MSGGRWRGLSRGEVMRCYFDLKYVNSSGEQQTRAQPPSSDPSWGHPTPNTPQSLPHCAISCAVLSTEERDTNGRLVLYCTFVMYKYSAIFFTAVLANISMYTFIIHWRARDTELYLCALFPNYNKVHITFSAYSGLSGGECE